MKRVVKDKELKEKMREAIDLLCDTVKVTLGPKGNNVMIDHSNFSPFITNDGVTIAQNIESDDEVINTILEFAKEASIKTNEIVGDGTTTTLVLLQSIYNEYEKIIKEGVNPLIIKKELENVLFDIINKIYIKSSSPKKKDLLNIATISSNDEFIGKIVSDAYLNAKNKSAISIKEVDSEKTLLKLIKGYKVETMFASPYFLNDKKEIRLNNALVLLFDDKVKDLDELSFILNEVINKNKSLIIIANDYSEDIINDIVSLNIDKMLNIYLLKTTNYGFKQINILKDISAITNARIIKHDIALLNDLGLTNVYINEETTTFSFIINNRINDRIKEIEKELENARNDYERNFFLRNLSMFNTCLAIIEVGATTKTERREKKMRYDDALCAIDISKNGVLPGSGISLLEIADSLSDDNYGSGILKKALIAPINQILINAGLNNEKIIEEIRQNNYKIIYNVKTEEFENIRTTNIKDPTEVIVNSLKNACSIASMLLTSSNLIINEYKNNYNKINDFNEL